MWETSERTANSISNNTKSNNNNNNKPILLKAKHQRANNNNDKTLSDSNGHQKARIRMQERDRKSHRRGQKNKGGTIHIGAMLIDMLFKT